MRAGRASAHRLEVARPQPFTPSPSPGGRGENAGKSPPPTSVKCSCLTEGPRPLESLARDRDPIADTLSAAEEKRFDRWKEDGRKPAWFLLDAVDELKLTGGKLDRALNRFSKAMDGRLDRARIIISCRPSDWRSGSDLHTVQHRLRVPDVRRESSVKLPEDVFLEALRHERGRQSHATPEQEEVPNQGTVRTVAMLPMNDSQIKVFAEWRGIHDPAAFLLMTQTG